MFFNIYINDLIDKISKFNFGCKYGISSSNLIAYADDVVLLAPSIKGLQMLINEFHSEISNLKLTINIDKSTCIVFTPKRYDTPCMPSLYLGNDKLNVNETINYLGTIINSTLNAKQDIIRCRNSFFNSFNSILRKFNSLTPDVLLFLFKTYCVHMYGANLWLNTAGCSQVIRQFQIGYHKAIKKIYNVSSRESNHLICNAAQIMMFNHYINYVKIRTFKKFLTNPCQFIERNFNTFLNNSFFIQNVRNILNVGYGVPSLTDNDLDAIRARIFYVQYREEPLR